MHLVVGAEQWVPWLRITEDPYTGHLTYSGIMFNLLVALSRTMNFTYEVRRPEDGLWGVGFPNGSWSGMLGMVKRGLILTWLILVVFLYLSPYERLMTTTQRQEGGVQTRRKYSNKSHVMWLTRTLASQSNPWLPESDSRRVMTASWLLSCLIFVSVFSGTLTAMLSVPLVRLPIDSTEDLVNQQEVPWAIESGSFLYQILYQATDGIYKTLWDGHSARITDCYSYRHDIGAGEYAAVCDKMTMKKVMSEDFSATGECNFYMAREDFMSMPMALAFQHQHPIYSKANLQWVSAVALSLSIGGETVVPGRGSHSGPPPNSSSIFCCFLTGDSRGVDMQYLDDVYTVAPKNPHDHRPPEFPHPGLVQEREIQILELVNKGLVHRWMDEQLPNGTACLGPPGADLIGAKRPLALNDYFGLFSVFALCKFSLNNFIFHRKWQGTGIIVLTKRN
ncbi:Glutamate receptor 1-like 9 [Homarus americanus]|uniref:Glutamate receptor 1-like 9 n=1 Tax=Homarus americanus TaxID=6706 RepID=A0A8J5JCS0_HOMAM|nr:Glutamate receptor 1-like 9 [Homarus americanus]